MILENINYFHEVFNPLYAFPVVGVVLCAILVFAFGFKTPAQPPSFDFVEHRKVTAKKKSKSKEIKSVHKPVQNGSAHASEPATPPVPALSGKAQNNKIPKTNETPAPKKNTQAETKSKSKKTVSSIPDEKVEATDEVNDNTGSGEWMQKLSRKDRKNRKGKDVNVNLKNTINLLTVSSKENEVAPAPAPDKLRKEVADSTEESTEDKENANQVDPSAEEEPLVKKDVSSQDVSSKKAKKKKKDISESDSKVEADSKKEETPALKSTNKKAVKVVKDSSKAENEIEAGNNIQLEMDLSREMQIEKPQPKVPEREVAKEAAPAKTPEKQETPVADPDTREDSAKTTSNVVFDELGDMWQDAKPQKKKKKVRRE